jgi:SAM-dependent methyltransferase
VDSTGNTAKDYCLQRVAELARTGARLVIVDLGCGDGRNVEPLLREHPSLRYVGIDPSRAAVRAAAARLAGYDVELHVGRAYDVKLADADVVLSFSVLEHVYRREPYVRSIALNLARDGRALVNYDAGHFTVPSERWKAPVRRALARIGSDSRYQAPVREAELARLFSDAGLAVSETRFFNTHLKELYQLVPDKERFARLWLEVELALNDAIDYREEYASVLRTRNFVLRRASDASA